MKDTVFGQTTLIIPIGSPPGAPQWQVLTGTAIPPELQTYYSNQVVTVEIFRATATRYTYYAQLTAAVNTHAIGTVTAGVVNEALTYNSALPGITSMFLGGRGTTTLNVGDNGLGGQGTIQIVASGQLSVAAGGALNIITTGTFTIDSKSAPRGMLDFTSATATTGFLGPGTNVILTTPSIAFRTGRAFLLEFEADVEGSVASNQAELMIHHNGVKVLRFAAAYPMASVAGFGTTCKGSIVCTNTTGSTVNAVLVLTLGSLIAGQVRTPVGANVDRPYVLRTFDIGAASDYPGAMPI